MITATDLSGLHVALVTPLDAAGNLDADGLDRLLTRVRDGGAQGVCPTGSTGEGPRLTRAMRLDVLRAVRSRVPTDFPVVPAPSALNAPDVVSEIDDFAAAGADASLVAAPSYYPMAPDDVASFYTAVADAAITPIVIYNIPPMTQVSVPPSVVGNLAEHPNVIGIKDSSRNFEYLQAIVYATEGRDFSVLTGSDTMLLPSLIVGARGTIAASANLVPQLGRAVVDAFSAGDLAKASQAQRELYQVIMASRSEVTPAGWKAALAIAGVCDARLAAPAHPLPDEQQANLATRLKELGVVSREDEAKPVLPRSRTLSDVVAVSRPAQLGEAPIWDADRNRLMWVDIPGATVHELDPASGGALSAAVSPAVTTIALPASGDGYVVGAGLGIARFTWPEPSFEWIAHVDSGSRVNDGKPDPAGRMVIGTMAVDDAPGTGELYQVDGASGAVTTLATGATVSNGLDWSPDYRTMYYIDTPLELIEAFDYDVATGAVSNRRTFVDLHDVPGRPDGMTVDSEGAVWVAMARGGAAVRRYLPSGQPSHVVELPVPNATSVAFGGADLADLYVTTSQLRLSEDDLRRWPDSGCLLTVPSVGVRGRPPFRFGATHP